MNSRSLLLVLLVLACMQPFTKAQSQNTPEACCFSFLKYRPPVRVIETYKETERECPRAGIIFTLKNGRSVCADPGLKWVQNIMKQIDKLQIESLNKNQIRS